MIKDILYTGCALDRADHLRRDDGWLMERLLAPETRFVPVWRDLSLVISGKAPAMATISGTGGAPFRESADAAVLLGLDESGHACFAIDLSSHEEKGLAGVFDAAEFTDLRRVGALMDQADGALLAYARGMLHWHRRHRFCGVCGSPTMSRQGGHLRVCTNADCAAEHFPRTDPAVIMLVTRPGPDGGACLLARQSRWPRGMVSTLAGFVEPGESLEEAVAREVYEETAVAVGNVRYRGSQPWPFPSSLMLGFRAEAEAGAPITFDRHELEDARWFTRADIADFPAMGLKLPRRDSIARWLVDEWMHDDGGSG